MNSVKWPCSPWVLVAQWIVRPSWVGFLSGTQIFSLSHVRAMLNNSSLTLQKTIYWQSGATKQDGVVTALCCQHLYAYYSYNGIAVVNDNENLWFICYTAYIHPNAPPGTTKHVYSKTHATRYPLPSIVTENVVLPATFRSINRLQIHPKWSKEQSTIT